MIRKFLDFIRKLWVWKGGGYIEVIEAPTPTVGINEALENPILRAALTRIAQSASSVPLLVYKGEDFAPEGDPASTFAERFNEEFTTPNAVQTIVSDLILFGNSFWKVRKVGRRILALDYIHPTQVAQDLEGKHFIIYSPEGSETLARDELVHFKLYNPADPQGLGLPLVVSIKQALTLLREIDKLAAEFFHNGAIPLGVVINKNVLTDQQRQYLYEKIQARIGRGHRYNWLVLTGDMDLKVVDVQLNNANLLELKRILREEILSCLNVPPAIVGVFEYANYANAREQTKIFWRETIIPMLTLIQETLNLQFFARHFGQEYWCAFDTTQVDALQEHLTDVADSAVRLVQSGIITINEARQMLGFEEPLAWGDTWWGNISVVPIAQRKSLQSSPIVIAKNLSQRELVFWQRFLRWQSKYERFIQEALQDYAEGLRKRLRGALRGKDITDRIYDPDEEAQILWETLAPIYEEILHKAPEIFEVSVEDQILFDAKVRAHLLQFKNRIQWISETQYERLKEVLADALESGGNLIDAVESVVGEIETWRAERIARTESTAALNAGYTDSLILAGFRKKMWLAALDERTRETHAQAHGQVVGVEEPFNVGGYLLKYPADPNAPPEETINCRCTVIPVD